MADDAAIKISSQSQFDAEFAPIRDFLRHTPITAETTWEAVDAQLRRLSAITRGGGHRANSFVASIESIQDQLIEAISTERTRLAITATAFINHTVGLIGARFLPLLQTLAPPVFRLTGRTNKLIMGQAIDAVRSMVTALAPSCPSLMHMIVAACTDKSKTTRAAATNAITLAITSWPMATLESTYADDIERVLCKLCEDSDKDVREAARVATIAWLRGVGEARRSTFVAKLPQRATKLITASAPELVSGAASGTAVAGVSNAAKRPVMRSALAEAKARAKAMRDAAQDSDVAHFLPNAYADRPVVPPPPTSRGSNSSHADRAAPTASLAPESGNGRPLTASHSMTSTTRPGHSAVSAPVSGYPASSRPFVPAPPPPPPVFVPIPVSTRALLAHARRPQRGSLVGDMLPLLEARLGAATLRSPRPTPKESSPKAKRQISQDAGEGRTKRVALMADDQRAPVARPRVVSKGEEHRRVVDQLDPKINKASVKIGTAACPPPPTASAAQILAAAKTAKPSMTNTKKTVSKAVSKRGSITAATKQLLAVARGTMPASALADTRRQDAPKRAVPVLAAVRNANTGVKLEARSSERKHKARVVENMAVPERKRKVLVEEPVRKPVLRGAAAPSVGVAVPVAKRARAVTGAPTSTSTATTLPRSRTTVAAVRGPKSNENDGGVAAAGNAGGSWKERGVTGRDRLYAPTEATLARQRARAATVTGHAKRR